MSDIAIRVEGLGKRYRIGKRQASYGTLRDSVAETFAKPLRAARSLMTRNGNGHSVSATGLTSDPRPLTSGSGSSPTDFWALEDVSFEVARGEVVGIIGRNGAGKSTLLKILSRITEPTRGEVDIYGRVGSLLEVGTGFHPELTGRENIYLNGSILGMRRTEIRKQFDEIVAFAEIEEFIDTPVKHYSSGMYVRLAFAVAAHLETEILVVDEVLAVGDAGFQRRCLGKMGEVAGCGRTVLLVSHNMAAIRSLSPNVAWLDCGRIRKFGESRTVIDNYLSSDSAARSSFLNLDAIRRSEAFGSKFKIRSIEFNSGKAVRHGEKLTVRIDYASSVDCEGVSVGFGFSTLDGSRIMTVDSDQSGPRKSITQDSTGVVEARVAELLLQPGIYTLDVGARSSDYYGLDYLPTCGQIEVLPGPNTPAVIIRDMGGVRVPGDWTW
jgi:lipopolysaccharide transport system ATP-binding protein